MYQNIRACEREFLGCLEEISFEFQLRRPSVRTITSECDMKRYVKKVLGVVNPIQRQMYGIEIRRVRGSAGGKDFYIARSKLGQLFVFSAAPQPDDIRGGPKPHIVSNLVPVGSPEDLIIEFLDDLYYDQCVELDQDQDGGEVRFLDPPVQLKIRDPVEPREYLPYNGSDQKDAVADFLAGFV